MKGKCSNLGTAFEGARAHLSDELECAAQLLPGATERDHGGVRVSIAQPPQRVALRQRSHPVKQLPRPAEGHTRRVSLLRA